MNYENQRDGMNADNAAALNVFKASFESKLQTELGEERLKQNQSGERG